jgi:hypothetical protein
MLMHLLADSTTQVTMDDFKSGYGGLIFTGCFFLVLIFVGIWWLKRNA